MATLVVTHTETLTLDGRNRSASKTFSLDVDNIYERTLSVAASATTIAVFKSTEAIADGSIDIQEAKYIRITNTDTSDLLLLTFTIDSSENDATDANEFISVGVTAGESFILGTPHDNAAVGSMMSTDTNLHDISKIEARNGTDSTNLKLEIYVAGKES